MFDVGALSATLELDRNPFRLGLQAARSEAQRFEREGVKATVNLDAANAERRLAQVSRDRTINADLDLDTAAAEAKLLLLQRQASSIGGGVGGVGGTGGGGGGGILGPGGFFRPSPLIAGGALAASFLPTIGASAVQGALGAGALGLGLGGAGAIGGAGILAAAAPAISRLKDVTAAQDNLNEAVRTYGKDSAQAKTATKQLEAAQQRLPQSGQQVTGMLTDIEHRWQSLSAPGQSDFFGILHDGLQTVSHDLPMFAQVSNQAMGAARDAADHFFHSLESADFHTFVTQMSDLFDKGIGPTEAGLENIFHVLGRIAVAVAPDVLTMLEGFASTTHQWEVDTRNAADLQRSVHGTVQEFGDWFDLATSLGHVLSALFITNQQGARKGGQEVEAVAHQLDQWARWIEHHHHDINAFFGQLNDDVGLLLSSAGQIASVVLPAFKPVADIIHEIVTDLNSVKVGNVSALTVLLGIIAARSIGGKLGLVGAGAAAGGGLTAAEAGGAGAAGGIGARLGAAALARLPMLAGGAALGAGSAVAFQSLAGKPGTFLGPGIAGLVPDAGEFTHAIRRDLSIQQTFHNKSLAQLEALRSEMQGQWHRLWETDPETAQSAGAEAMARTAHDTAAQLRDQIKAINLGGAFAESVAEGRPQMRHELNKVENAFDDMPKSVQNATIKAAKQQLDGLQAMGLITQRQERQALNSLEDAQQASLRRQRHKWDQFGQNVNSLVSGWFGSMAGTVNTILGNKGITGMVNQLLTGVGSQHALKWNATTAGRVAGTLAGFLNIGGQRGGFTGGWSSFDDRMVPMRGNEAILRGEDHVPLVSAALQRTYGFTLGDLFARTGGTGGIGGYARGGSVKLLPGVNMTQGSEPTILNDLRAFAGLEGQTVYVISGYRSPAHSVAVGGFANDPHTQGKAADIGLGAPTLASMASMGLEGPLNRVGLYRPFYPQSAAEANHVQLLGGGHGQVGGIGRIPRIVVHGPPGAIHDGLQGTADLGRREANRYLARQMAAVSMASGLGLGVPTGPIQQMARQMINRIWGPSQWSPFASLEMQEAGWNPRAVNPSSGAAGLAQALPPSKYPPGAWPYTGLHSAELQLQWMMGYIKDRYGSPSVAWGGYYGRGGYYGDGGRLGPGELGVVGERGIPELIAGRSDGGADVIAPGTLRKIQGAEPKIVVKVENRIEPRALRWLEQFMDTRVEVGIDGADAHDNALQRMHR